MTELLTPPEVAAILRVSVPTVRRMVKDGRLASVRVGSQLRFRPEDVPVDSERVERAEIAPAKPREPKGEFARLARQVEARGEKA